MQFFPINAILQSRNKPNAAGHNSLYIQNPREKEINKSKFVINRDLSKSDRPKNPNSNKIDWKTLYSNHFTERVYAINVQYCSFTSVSVEEGGAIYASDQKNVIVAFSGFQNCHSHRSGGAICFRRVTSIIRGICTDCCSSKDEGHFLCAKEGSFTLETFTASKCTVKIDRSRWSQYKWENPTSSLYLSGKIKGTKLNISNSQAAYAPIMSIESKSPGGLFDQITFVDNVASNAITFVSADEFRCTRWNVVGTDSWVILKATNTHANCVSWYFVNSKSLQMTAAGPTRITFSRSVADKEVERPTEIIWDETCTITEKQVLDRTQNLGLVDVQMCDIKAKTDIVESSIWFQVFVGLFVLALIGALCLAGWWVFLWYHGPSTKYDDVNHNHISSRSDDADEGDSLIPASPDLVDDD